MGCMVTGLRGCVCCVGPCVRGLCNSKCYVGCVGYVGQNNFYVGQHFTWVIIFTWVAWVKYIFAGGFVWITIFLCGSTKILIGAFTIIS